MNILLKHAIKITWPMIFHFFNASAQTYNYGEVLQKSLYFYECQRSGVLPQNNRVNWRGNSGVNDGMDNNVDLTGGWYDAGDHVKFGFPMANTATKLAWSAIENQQAYQSIGQWNVLLDNLRWVNNYFVKCHIKKKDGSTLRFFGQVGAGKVDHHWWGPAELMPMTRPSYFVDAEHPGSDLTAETAAAMSAASIVFKDIDPAYSAMLLSEAIALYAFAETYKGIYSNSIPDAKQFYESKSGYNDEMVWGAIWLYKATGDVKYLDKAKTAYKELPNFGDQNLKIYAGGDSWDNKAFACYVLMAVITGDSTYKNDSESHLDYWTTGYHGARVAYSPGGQAFINKWGSLRHAANTAFLAMVYGGYLKNRDPIKSKRYVAFAVNQINYLLGDNPLKRSFVVGFGNNPPINPHHRNAHGSLTGSVSVPINNKNIIYGALVGGPSKPNDTYTDSRFNFEENEVACDYNAGFTGAIAQLVSIYGGTAIKDFPEKQEKLEKNTSKGH
jgi:endoglucanase